jgi:hypothetical protein
MIISLASALLVAGSCTCSREVRTKPDAAQPIKRTPLPPAFPSEQLRGQMRKVQTYTEELGRRVKRGFLSSKGPDALLNTVKGMSRERVPKVFITRIDDLQERIAKVKDSKDLRGSYSLVVESCVACHQELAPSFVPHVTKLRLADPEDKRPGQGKARLLEDLDKLKAASKKKAGDKR